MSRLPPVPALTLAVAYLNTVDDITDIVGANISSKLPRPFHAGEDRAIRLTRLGGFPAARVGHLDRARIQVDAFGTSAPDAEELAGLTLAAFRDLPSSGFTYPGAVVTDVGQDLGLAGIPDPDTKADRWLFGVVLYCHPVEAVGSGS